MPLPAACCRRARAPSRRQLPRAPRQQRSRLSARARACACASGAAGRGAQGGDLDPNPAALRLRAARLEAALEAHREAYYNRAGVRERQPLSDDAFDSLADELARISDTLGAGGDKVPQSADKSGARGPPLAPCRVF